jgi:histidinol-phosphate/aromatic aminotransferase/cobyric acid decarboxylase-like protein
VVAAVSAIPPAGPHGGDGARVARALGIDPAQMLDLSQSLNPVAPDPRPVILAHLDSVSRYPDPDVAHEALAAAMAVDGDWLLLTNGGAEAIALVADQLGGSVNEPEFSLQPDWPARVSWGARRRVGRGVLPLGHRPLESR